ncbi:small subunit ribosomal protein S8 [Neolewinella xylanilytica]|uniref:Small ribosomal subunit protein uS8 n=1 Tax=Neolewinella xylanilytica TaxID=1514080 RepID=A0A2S6I2H2_9BACT|nr:30S ribosomal protein S8 [Neolewinella xylanilytica]PPK85377.1 small subunit ribosomal protein S8 [Neolewinella xylanilytica]
MAVTDPIADYLTRIRNAQIAGHRVVNIPASSTKKRLTEILYDQGFILKYKFDDEAGKGKQGVISIALKYERETKRPVIRKLVRVSKPGLRQYAKADSMPRVINGLGISIVSTSKGVMTGRQATEQNVGGEVLAYVY